MAWFSRVTRFADVHLCYAQEAANSCGIASVMMTVFKINKFSVSQAVHKEKEIYDQYSAITGSPYDGSQYSFASTLALALNGLKVGVWEGVFIGPTNVAQAIVDSVGCDNFGESLAAGPLAPAAWLVNQMRTRTPIIVLVGWNTSGAHFVVVDTVNKVGDKLYASVCDPWDGNVHITEFSLAAPFNYTACHVPGSWDLGGEKHEYAATSTGSPNGWVVRKKSP